MVISGVFSQCLGHGRHQPGSNPVAKYTRPIETIVARLGFFSLFISWKVITCENWQ